MKNFKKDILELASEIIKVPSTYDQPQNLKRVLNLALEPLKGFNINYYTRNNVSSVLISNTMEKNKFKIILNGHLNVVSASKESYNATLKGSRLYGRGAADMKAATAAMIILFKNIANSVDYPLALQRVTDEKVGGHNGTEYQLERGVKSEFVIVGEKTDLQILNQSKGVIKANLTFVGKSAHGAYPWNGRNAILGMCKFLSNWQLLNKSQYYKGWVTTVDIPIITTKNKEFNKVAEDCTVQVDIRFISQENPQKILENIKNILPKEITLDVVSINPALYTSENNIYINKLKMLVGEYTNSSVRLNRMVGASDGKYYTKAEIPIVVFGPRGKGIHEENE